MAVVLTVVVAMAGIIDGRIEMIGPSDHFLIALLAIVVVVVFFARSYVIGASRKHAELRARGIYPEDGHETDEDVLRLVQAGEKIMAIRCYRVLHKVGLKEAKDAVERLDKGTP